MSARYTGDRVSQREIRRIFHDDDGPVGRDVNERGRRVLAEARRRVGVQSGLLLSTIRLERGSNATGPYADIVAGVPGLTPYLGYHMEGTHAHVIRPRRRGGALRFVSNGRVVFARQVRHPGTRANDFLRDALRRA